MQSRRQFAISKTALKMVIIPMAIFGYQQYLIGNIWPAAGAATLIVATIAYELRWDLQHVPFDADDLKDAATRIGEAEQELAEKVNNTIDEHRSNS